jgi:hypothetical protein
MATAPKVPATAATGTSPAAATPTPTPTPEATATPAPDASLANVTKALSDMAAAQPTNPNAILLAKAREEAAKAAAATANAPGANVAPAPAPEPVVEEVKAEPAPSPEDVAAKAKQDAEDAIVKVGMGPDATPEQRIAEARISGSPMHLVAAKIAADEAAKVAADAANALLPSVAPEATATAPAGIAGTTSVVLRPDQAPAPSVYQPVGPGTTSFQTVPAARVAADGEELVKMTSPRKFNVTLPDYTIVSFAKGVNDVPMSLSTHPYVIANGATVVPERETRVVPPVQVGLEGKTAPVVVK